MNSATTHIFFVMLLLVFWFSDAQLFADENRQVVICAPDELSAPMKAIVKIHKNEDMILLDKGYVTWLNQGENRWVIFVHPFTRDFLFHGHPSMLDTIPSPVPLVQKGDLIYAMTVETLNNNFKPDPDLVHAAYADLMGAAAQKIFRSYGFKPVSK